MLFAALYAFYGEGLILGRGYYLVYLGLGAKLKLFIAFAVKAGGKARVAAFAAEYGVKQPVFLADEAPYLIFAVYDHSRRNGLHTSGGEAALYLFPEQRGQLIAHKAVEKSSRLLSVDKVTVDIPRVFDTLGDDLFCYLVEGYASGSVVRQVQQLLEMPRYGLALAVRVGRKIDGS